MMASEALWYKWRKMAQSCYEALLGNNSTGMDLGDIERWVEDFQDEHFDGWRDTNLGYYGLAISGEVGEMNNLIKKEIRDGDDHRELIKEELADVFIYTLILAARLGMNLEKEFWEKMIHNAQKFRRGRKLGREARDELLDVIDPVGLARKKLEAQDEKEGE